MKTNYGKIFQACIMSITNFSAKKINKEKGTMFSPLSDFHKRPHHTGAYRHALLSLLAT
jgi:hypothetical protein